MVRTAGGGRAGGCLRWANSIRPSCAGAVSVHRPGYPPGLKPRPEADAHFESGHRQLRASIRPFRGRYRTSRSGHSLGHAQRPDGVGCWPRGQDKQTHGRWVGAGSGKGSAAVELDGSHSWGSGSCRTLPSQAELAPSAKAGVNSMQFSPSAAECLPLRSQARRAVFEEPVCTEWRPP